MKRIVSLLLSVVLVLSMVPAAFAEETTPVATDYYVKYMAYDLRQIWSSVAREIDPEVSPNSPPSEFTSDQTLTVGGTSVTFHCVKPTYDVTGPASISADNPNNSDASTLQSYVRKSLTFKQTNPAYDSAQGSVEDKIVWPSIKNYDPTGGSYTLTGSINGYEYTVPLKVISLGTNEPDVTIGYGRTIECTPNKVEWSTDRRNWTKITSGGALPDSCSGDYVYFRTPATEHTEASGYIRIRCKDDQKPPEKSPQLASNSYSVWITNASELKGCEFSIDGQRYSDSTSWDNLDPNTNYTVYARFPGDSSTFPSRHISAGISTAEGAKNELKHTKVSTSDTVYMQASGTAALYVKNKVLTAAYTEDTIKDLKNDITNTARKTDVVTTLDVYMKQEETDDRVYNKVKFTIPKGLGLLQLRLHTPWFTVIRDSETTSVTLSDGGQATNQAVKAWATGSTHVYRVETEKKGAVTVLFPWVWPDRADLDGLKVSYIDAEGKESKILNYAVVTDGIQFTMPSNGYFSIRNLNRDYPTVPFNDCQASWAYSYICHAYETKLVNGTTETTFEPESKVTRAQLVTLMARMRGCDETKWYGELPYTDVAESDWFAPALSFCYYAGAIKPDGSEFNKNATVTRAEAAAMAEKLFKYSGVLWTPFNCSDRDSVPTYALHAMDALYTCGIMNGTSADTFSPSGELTRAEMVTILYRLQVADYWQTKNSIVTAQPLDPKLVKEEPNIWIDDGAEYFEKKTAEVKSAMQYFQKQTGVRPYLVTTVKKQSASGIYEDLFDDEGHMVTVLTKVNDRGGVTVETHVGTDAAKIITRENVDHLESTFADYWDGSSLSSSEALAYFYRNGADDIMSFEMSSKPNDWKAPSPKRPVNKEVVTSQEMPSDVKGILDKYDRYMASAERLRKDLPTLVNAGYSVVTRIGNKSYIYGPVLSVLGGVRVNLPTTDPSCGCPQYVYDGVPIGEVFVVALPMPSRTVNESLDPTRSGGAATITDGSAWSCLQIVNGDGDVVGIYCVQTEEEERPAKPDLSGAHLVDPDSAIYLCSGKFDDYPEYSALRDAAKNMTLPDGFHGWTDGGSGWLMAYGDIDGWHTYLYHKDEYYKITAYNLNTGINGTAKVFGRGLSSELLARALDVSSKVTTKPDDTLGVYDPDTASRIAWCGTQVWVEFIYDTPGHVLESKIPKYASSTVQVSEEPAVEPGKTLYQNCRMTFTDNDFIGAVKSGEVPSNFTEYSAVDENWQQCTGRMYGWNITVLKSKPYKCIRFSRENIEESINIEDLNMIFGMAINMEDFAAVAATAGNAKDITIVDPATASTLRMTENSAFGQILIDPPAPIVEAMLEGYKN